MMKPVFGEYRGWTVVLVRNWSKKGTVFFVVGPGPDPRVVHGSRASFDDAADAARKAIKFEATNEQSSRSNR
jgi:hypothetical protein